MGTTVTLYSGTGDGYLQSESPTYATARSGGGTVNIAQFGAGIIQVGQQQQVGIYYLREGFFEIDTSSIPDSAVIADARIEVYIQGDSSDTDFTIEARARDWGGGSLTSGDWVAGASLSGLTLLASLSTVGLPASGYVALTSSGSNLINAINKTGYTRFLLCSSRLTGGNAPSGLELVGFAEADSSPTQAVRLVITYGDEVSGATTLTCSAALSPLATAQRSGMAALAGAATVSALPKMDYGGATTLAPAASVGPLGSVAHSVAAALAATAQLSPDANIGVLLGVVALTGAASLGLVPAPLIKEASVSLVATALIAALPTHQRPTAAVQLGAGVVTFSRIPAGVIL